MTKDKPITLTEAARILEADFPRYAFTARQLKHMVDTRSIPYICMPQGTKRHAYRVRISDLLTTFETRFEREIPKPRKAGEKLRRENVPAMAPLPRYCDTYRERTRGLKLSKYPS